MAFGGQEGSPRPGRAWRFWGQGDIQTFAGEPSAERGYEGDWRAGSAGGRLETVADGRAPLPALVGPGHLAVGDGRRRLGIGGERTCHGACGFESLGLRLGLFEARRRFTDWLGLRAGAAWARLATGAGDETVDGRSAAVDQQRLGIELTPFTRLGGLAIEPLAQASARPPPRAPFRPRLRGARAGVTLTVGSPAAEEGLSLSVSPRWGGSASATGALWNDRHAALRPDAPVADGPWALDGRGRLLAWSGGLTRSARGYAFTIGGGIGIPVAAAAPPDGRGR